MKSFVSNIVAGAVLIHASASVGAFEVPSTEDWERREILVDPFSFEHQIVREDVLGHWTGGGFEGDLNFVLTSTDDERHRLYVQWLEAETQAPTYTVSIREFNVAPEYILSFPECLNDNCTRALVTGTHAYEGMEQRFILTLTGVGRYKVGLAAEE